MAQSVDFDLLERPVLRERLVVLPPPPPSFSRF